MANESDEKFFEHLSDAEFDEAEQIERDVHAALTEGLSKETAQSVIRGVMLIRKKEPGVLVANLIDAALSKGINFVVAAVYGLDVTGASLPKARKAKLVR